MSQRHALTPREKEVLQRIVMGDTDKEIANRLSISPRTVGSIVSRILMKMDVRDRTEAATKGMHERIVTFPDGE